jgi:hypothetical protein
MQEIPLYKGRGGDRAIIAIASVDDEDFDRLNPYTWLLHSGGYAWRTETRHDKRKFILMHREILGATDCEVDHIDGNRLHNVKSNLRLCSRLQNGSNQLISSSNSSGYKGVHFFKRDGNWQAYIKVKQKRIHLGYFQTPELAASAYNEAAVKYFGEFAKLNRLV